MRFMATLINKAGLLVKLGKLQAQSIGPIFAKDGSLPDVPAHRLQRSMPGLIHDGSLGLADCGGRGREAGPQTVSGKILNSMPETPDISFDYDGHGFPREPLIENAPVAIHLFITRNSDPLSIFAAALQFSTARMGQVASSPPRGMPTSVGCSAKCSPRKGAPFILWSALLYVLLGSQIPEGFLHNPGTIPHRK